MWSKSSNTLISLSEDNACVWLVPPAENKAPLQPAAVQTPTASLQFLASFTAKQLAAFVSPAGSAKSDLAVMPASAALVREVTAGWQAWLPTASGHITHFTQSMPGSTPANKPKLQPVSHMLQYHKVCHADASPDQLLQGCTPHLTVFGSP